MTPKEQYIEEVANKFERAFRGGVLRDEHSFPNFTGIADYLRTALAQAYEFGGKEALAVAADVAERKITEALTSYREQLRKTIEKYEQAYHFDNEFLGAMRKIKPALLQENQSESSTGT